MPADEHDDPISPGVGADEEDDDEGEDEGTALPEPPSQARMSQRQPMAARQELPSNTLRYHTQNLYFIHKAIFHPFHLYFIQKPFFPLLFRVFSAFLSVHCICLARLSTIRSVLLRWICGRSMEGTHLLLSSTG